MAGMAIGPGTEKEAFLLSKGGLLKGPCEKLVDEAGCGTSMGVPIFSVAVEVGGIDLVSGTAVGAI